MDRTDIEKPYALCWDAMPPSQRAHLTYCTNVHPAQSWSEVRATLGHYLPQIKARVSPHAPFGVGLWLSELAARELDDPAALAQFKAFLRTHDLYVFTLNGFPFGSFHQQSVKDAVYLPDWRDPRRLEYSNRLARLLAQLLPDDQDIEGSISTVAGGFKPHLADDPQCRFVMAKQLLEHAVMLHRLHQETGRCITLALEPEPCCLLETTAETITFFEEYLLNATATEHIAAACVLDDASALALIRRHLGVCIDTCHAAVEFEDPNDMISRFRQAGIRIAKLQLSAGLRVPRPCASHARALQPFAEQVYLHQVIERRTAETNAELQRMIDLPDALSVLNMNPSVYKNTGDECEWRIHFHVPVWADTVGPFESTQPFLKTMLAMQRDTPISTHLEVETYTWHALPAVYQPHHTERTQPTGSLIEAISHELQWVQEQLK
ncbi:metabolite traffic protein EboE [Mycetohabitans endofungorum]|uniref:metabolite traffic protein EboE n=1 Tax=Mycetohabitans endofungorum TaxID=417203 RepID=UPI0030D1A673